MVIDAEGEKLHAGGCRNNEDRILPAAQARALIEPGIPLGGPSSMLGQPTHSPVLK